MTSLYGCQLISDFLMAWRKLEWGQGHGFFCFWVLRFEYDHWGEPLGRFALQIRLVADETRCILRRYDYHCVLGFCPFLLLTMLREHVDWKFACPWRPPNQSPSIWFFSHLFAYYLRITWFHVISRHPVLLLFGFLFRLPIPKDNVTAIFLWRNSQGLFCSSTASTPPLLHSSSWWTPKRSRKMQNPWGFQLSLRLRSTGFLRDSRIAFRCCAYL